MKKKKWTALLLAAALSLTVLEGCGNQAQSESGTVVTICKQAA